MYAVMGNIRTIDMFRWKTWFDVQVLLACAFGECVVLCGRCISHLSLDTS